MCKIFIAFQFLLQRKERKIANVKLTRLKFNQKMTWISRIFTYQESTPFSTLNVSMLWIDQPSPLYALTLPLTYIVYPSCTSTISQCTCQWQPIFNYLYFRDTACFSNFKRNTNVFWAHLFCAGKHNFVKFTSVYFKTINYGSTMTSEQENT